MNVETHPRLRRREGVDNGGVRVEGSQAIQNYLVDNLPRQPNVSSVQSCGPQDSSARGANGTEFRRYA